GGGTLFATHTSRMIPSPLIFSSGFIRFGLSSSRRRGAGLGSFRVPLLLSLPSGYGDVQCLPTSAGSCAESLHGKILWVHVLVFLYLLISKDKSMLLYFI